MVQQALLESYLVLTRGPAPLRHHPDVAYQMLHVTYGACIVIGTSSPDIWRFLSERDFRTAGGRLYDALIAVTAIENGADQLLTFNRKHFEAFADRIEIVVPV